MDFREILQRAGEKMAHLIVEFVAMGTLLGLVYLLSRWEAFMYPDGGLVFFQGWPIAFKAKRLFDAADIAIILAFSYNTIKILVGRERS